MKCPRCGASNQSIQYREHNRTCVCMRCRHTNNERYFMDMPPPYADKEDKIFGPNGQDPRKNSFAPPINPEDKAWENFNTPNVGEKDAEILAQGGTKFETGAVRSADKANVRYDLISPIGMRRLAETMEEGRQKYGYFNWERGMPIGDILNHAIAHIYAYLEDKPTGEDDLAHAAWNLFAAMHMEETHPNLDHQIRFHLVDKYNPEPPALHNKNE